MKLFNVIQNLLMDTLRVSKTYTKTEWNYVRESSNCCMPDIRKIKSQTVVVNGQNTSNTSNEKVHHYMGSLYACNIKMHVYRVCPFGKSVIFRSLEI